VLRPGATICALLPSAIAPSVPSHVVFLTSPDFVCIQLFAEARTKAAMTNIDFTCPIGVDRQIAGRAL